MAGSLPPLALCLLGYRNQAKCLGNISLFVVKRGELESQMLVWTRSQEKGAGSLGGLVEAQPHLGGLPTPRLPEEDGQKPAAPRLLPASPVRPLCLGLARGAWGV